MFDLHAFSEASVVGSPLLFGILGRVEWFKGYVEDTKVIRGISMAIGLLPSEELKQRAAQGGGGRRAAKRGLTEEIATTRLVLRNLYRRRLTPRM